MKNIKQVLVTLFIVFILVVLEIIFKILIDNNKLFFNEKPTRLYRFNNNSLFINDLLCYKTFSNYQDVEFVDLLKYFNKEKYHEKYYFTCDHHFNLNNANL